MRISTLLGFAALFALPLVTVSACRADEEGDQVQKLLTAQSPSVVTVKIVMKTAFNFGGQSQDQESRQELQGVVVSADGLIMLSNSTFSADRLKEMMSGAGGDAGNIDIKMTPTDFKIVFEKNEKEYKAFLAASDAVLGLAFLKVEDPTGLKLTPVDFSGTTAPVMGQKLIGISRLSKGYDYAPYYNSARLSGIVSKPRKAYLLDGSVAGIGLPVYTMTGETVGVLTMLASGVKEDADSGGAGFGMMFRALSGGFGGMGRAFLIPNANVSAVIAQAKQRAVEVAAERAKKKDVKK